MKQTQLTRRAVLRTGTAAAAMLAAPPFLRLATAATPVKIGIPTVITGGYAVLGSHVMRTCKLVEKIGGVELNLPAQMGETLEVGRARPPHHADDAIALLEQELGEVRAVLAGDAGDERGRHGPQLRP